MSNEVSQQGANLGAYALMPTMTMGVGAIKNMRRWGKSPSTIIGKLSGSTDGFIQKIAPNADYFTRTTMAGQVGNAYKDIVKGASKYDKMQTKINGINAQIKELEAVRSKAAKKEIASLNRTKDKLSKKLSKGENALDLRKSADEALEGFKNGTKTIDEVQDALKISKRGGKYVYSEILAKNASKGLLGTAKGFGRSIAGNFKQEISIKNGNGCINYLMTVLTTVVP